MKRLFFYLFGSIVVLFLLVGGMSYAILEAQNEKRYLEHIDSHMLPVANLVSVGLQRQPAAKQNEWLNLVRELLGISLEPQEQPCATRLDISTKTVGGQSYETCFQVEGNKSIVFRLEALSEELFSTMAFLILNELGTVQAKERQALFDQIKRSAPFPVYRSKKVQQKLSDKQRSLLQQGRIIVQWKKQFDKAEHLLVVAPWGGTSDSLVLGPIPLFEPYPKNQIYLIIFVVLLLLASIVLMILKYLTREIQKVQLDIDTISREQLGLASIPYHSESISSIGETIVQLVERIKYLLQEKNYAIRAISHDLRTPISRMLFRVESIEDDVGKAALPLKRDLLHMESLIKQLLSYEQLSVNQKLSLRKVDVELLAKEALAGFCEVNSHLTYVRRVSLGDNKQACLMDRELIYQGLQNLLQNASRFAGTEVVLSVSARDGGLEFAVLDDGPGLPSDGNDKLFDPFYKADKSRGGTSLGFGFGLSIVKKIALLHGGKVKASNRSNKGAAFYMHIPIKNEDVEEGENV
ncbi:HAMP domain-containing sensor histidine kinase [uncultured Pseudoteredinibacter sp.]|uniref:sensor histidine kinase n=1 Tax=uncultured Pseudoteredinibacter sp. TaxID=1641701 RepID=UPI00262D17DA|nr:HAMP domain-containing sensor histidine kinase [uncultured Pseudoteredinibacter sp.]